MIFLILLCVFLILYNKISDQQKNIVKGVAITPIVVIVLIILFFVMTSK